MVAKSSTVNPLLSPEEQKRFARIIDLARRKNDVEAEIAMLREDAKGIVGEGKMHGVTGKQIKIAQELLVAEKEASVVEDMRFRHGLMRALNIDFGFQMELFTDPRPAEERAHQEGWADSAAGKSLQNPYAPTLPQYDAYAFGWHEHQALAREQLRESMDMQAAKKAAEAGQATGGGPTPPDDQVDLEEAIAETVQEEEELPEPPATALKAAAERHKNGRKGKRTTLTLKERDDLRRRSGLH